MILRPFENDPKALDSEELAKLEAGSGGAFCVRGRTSGF